MELWTPFSELSSRANASETRDPSPTFHTRTHGSEHEFPVMDPGSAHACGMLVRDDNLLLRVTQDLLTTAEILYALPDYPMLVQTYIWQDYDHAPRFPLLKKFLKFWERDIEGRLQHVTVSVREHLGAAKFTFYADEFLA